ncbi:MAG: Uma2 family endonuclease [Symploca sp. SIO2E9]|nr:Uma2 family endonuclease [Symploca sp. SIO2E9]
MTAAIQKFTFEEYLKYDDGTDTRYELVQGELVPMSLATGKHGAIIRYLERKVESEIEKLEQPWISLSLLVGIRSPRGGRWDTCRIPDLTVIAIEQWEAMQEREALIELDEAPPLLVVEVVSESTKSADYRAKYSEYSVLEIPEYWIVDPLENKITICQLNEGRYDEMVLTEKMTILSPTFPELKLSVAQVLAGKF